MDGTINRILKITEFIGSAKASQTFSEETAAQLARQASSLHDQAKQLSSSQKHSAGCFEWVDGALLRAMERGEWVLLDNANMCNPTVLDRLNPLLGTA